MPAKTISSFRLGSRLLILGAVLLLSTVFTSSALAGLRPLPAQSGRCSGIWTINGEHINRANAFQVSGVNCQYAMLSATDYTDSALAIPNAGSTTPIMFEAGGYPWLYHWRCRETSSTGPHEYTYYHCRADGRPDGYHGTAYMSFKWWLGPTRSCPTFPVDEAQEWLAASTWATRNQTCSSAEEWIRTASQSIHRFGQAYAITSGHFGDVYHYHYYSSNGANESNEPRDGDPFLCSSEHQTELQSEAWECAEQTKMEPRSFGWREVAPPNG
jgi:hypothetical protein